MNLRNGRLVSINTVECLRLPKHVKFVFICLHCSCKRKYVCAYFNAACFCFFWPDQWKPFSIINKVDPFKFFLLISLYSLVRQYEMPLPPRNICAQSKLNWLESDFTDFSVKYFDFSKSYNCWLLLLPCNFQLKLFDGVDESPFI